MDGELMCANWRILDDGSPVPCRECWQCRHGRVEDWAGRCIAESKTSAHTLVGTLTYGESQRIDGADRDLRAQMLTYSDVQIYLKRLRKWTPGGLRFFVVGEYGSAKGRAHWHVIAFFKTHLPPNLRFGERFTHWAVTPGADLEKRGKAEGRKLWEHGFSFWEPANSANMRYALKYIVKDLKGPDQKTMGLSKCPPLGDAYFALEAARYVAHGLSPQKLEYRFPEDTDREGRPRVYRLAGAPAFNFLSHFDQKWQAAHGSQAWPQSEIMDLYVDERDRRERIRLHQADWPEDVFLERLMAKGKKCRSEVVIDAEIPWRRPHRGQ